MPGRIEMKLSEYYDEITGIKIAGGRSLIKNNLKPDMTKLEAENEELRELFVYFFGENYEELGEQDA